MISLLPSCHLCLAVLAFCSNIFGAIATTKEVTKSGLKTWVDIDTPKKYFRKTNSRGEKWDLVMSDEFNIPGRNFRPGKDHLWTALELPDGVNAALEYYSWNMTGTVKDKSGRGYFQIITQEANISLRIYNAYKKPSPGFESISMYYRSGMVQSWNKFCFQGGLVEVSAQIPGAVSSKSKNPDLTKEENFRVLEKAFYPTWPGIWLLGNLGRALFSASNNRMWPWSFNECDKSLEKDQRISACNKSPGHGLNPGQGRGAPEIDILEGGGTDISSSIQAAPGMPDKFRTIIPDDPKEVCFFARNCKEIGANAPDVPTAFYKQRRSYKSWYQGLRYSPNTFCDKVAKDKQSYTTIKASLKKGIVANTCSAATCPGSYDVNGDLGLIDEKGPQYWNINYDGSCMPIMNGYTGAYLCDPNNKHKKCGNTGDSPPIESKVSSFNYQMDAISANWPVPLKAYTGYLTYQMEWVPGKNGYVRWMLDDRVIFEIPAEAMTNPPQDSANSNPKKIMIEEPLYVIFNTALSSSWGTSPPNAGKPCRGNGKDAKVNRICDEFPMSLKIDYIRIWQNTKSMAVGCDPKSHPTKQFINDNIKDYIDDKNPYIIVAGGATCNSDDDCSVRGSSVLTGSCVKKRCSCLSPKSWGGPRCTTVVSRSDREAGGNGDKSSKSSKSEFGPTILVSISLWTVTLFLTFFIFIYNKYFKKETALVSEILAKNEANAEKNRESKETILSIS